MSRRGDDWRRIISRLLAGCCLLLLVFAPVRAEGHAELIASTPSDGETVQETPEHLRLRFSEEILLASVRLHLTDRDLDLTVSLAPQAQAPTSADVIAPLPRLTADVYVASWRATSADDGHEIAGAIAFGVRRAAATAADTTRTATPLDAGLAIVAIVATGLSVGAALVLVLAGTALRGIDEVRRRAIRLARDASTTAAAATLGTLVVSASRPGGEAILTTTHALRVGLASVALASVAVAAHWWRAATRPPAQVLLVATGTAAALRAVDGHTLEAGADRVVFVSIHAAAAAVWAGGLVVLTVLIVPLLRHDDARRHGAVQVLRGFARPAIVSLAVLVMTGLALAGPQLGTLALAAGSPYGWILGIKLAALILASVLGLRHFLHLRRQRPTSGMRLGSLRVEALAVVGLLTAAAVLTVTPPSNQTAAVSSGTPAAIGDLSALAGDLVVKVSLRPTTPGPSVALIKILDSRRPSPGPATAVVLSIGGTAVTAEEVGPRRWQAPIELPEGDVALSASIERAGLPTQNATMDWRATTNSSLADRPLLPLLDRAAAVLALAMLAGCAIALALGRDRRTYPSTVHPSGSPSRGG